MTRRRARSVSLRKFMTCILAAAFLLIVTHSVGHSPSVGGVLEGLQDWARHFGSYFLLTLGVAVVACLAVGGVRPRAVLFALLLCAGYGVLQEVRQSRLVEPLEWQDIAWNGVGAGLAAVLLAAAAALVRRMRPRWARAPR